MGKNNVRFKSETTGSLMKKEFIALKGTNTVEKAIGHLRENVKGKKNIHYIYILNQDGVLAGALSLRELLSAENDQLVNDVMVREVISFTTEVDQEEAAKIFRDTDLASIPVTDKYNQLIGVIHVDDILDVMQQEATEDFHRMASVDTSPPTLEGGLMDATVGMLYRKRVAWLVILVFMNVFSGAGIAYFESTIATNIALVFFLPLLIDSGGNAGSQSATLVIRAMATGEVKIKDWFTMFLKEISVSSAIGLTMAVAVSGIGIMRGGVDIAVVVSLTMVIIVIVGSLIGMSLPFIFRKLNLDPAVASTPLVTSICDIVGVLIYFSIATWYLVM